MVKGTGHTSLSLRPFDRPEPRLDLALTDSRARRRNGRARQPHQRGGRGL